MYGPGDVRVDERAEPRVVEPTDATISVSAARVCRADLSPYRGVDSLHGGHAQPPTSELPQTPAPAASPLAERYTREEPRQVAQPYARAARMRSPSSARRSTGSLPKTSRR